MVSFFISSRHQQESSILITVFVVVVVDSLGYRPFMMMLQPQVNLLDRFVIQQESIPNFMPPLGARQPQMQFHRGADGGLTNLAKNVCNLLKFF